MMATDKIEISDPRPCAGALSFTKLFKAFGDIYSMFTPEERWYFFQAGGYISG